MRLSLIVAVAENGTIGRDGDLPWRLSGDLRRFKNITMGHALIMGRKTFESIGRPLPGRTSIVISRDPNYVAEGCTVVANWESAKQAIPAGVDAFVIGGKQIYEMAFADVSRMYWTQVHASVSGDVEFSNVDWSEWELVYDEPHAADANNQFPFSFRMYDRVTSSR